MANLDMAMDDMMKMKEKKPGSNPSKGPRAPNSGPGPSRRLPDLTASRTTPHSHVMAQASETKWQLDMFADHAAAYPARANRMSSVQTGTELLISNLDYGVSDEDIKELFSEVGDLKQYSVDYDKSGRSKGMAEVFFSRHKDAEAAVNRYNNAQLDGKPMKIKVVGENSATAAIITLTTNGTSGYQSGAPKRKRWSNGTNIPMRGRGRGIGHGEKVSAEDLDADFERYDVEAMHTN